MPETGASGTDKHRWGRSIQTLLGMNKMFFHILLASHLLFILTASVAPSEKLGVDAMPGGFDKLVHFIMYGLLASITSLSLGAAEHNRPQRILAGCFVLSILYGVVMESIQFFLPTRTFSWTDIMANTIGSATGIILLNTILRKSRQG